MRRSRLSPIRDTPRRSMHPIRPPDEAEHVRTVEVDTTAEERAAYARCHLRPGCAAHAAPDCTDRNQHAHHRLLQSHGGPTIDANLLNVCLRCHAWIHAHPAEAYERGWMLRDGVDAWAQLARTAIPEEGLMQVKIDESNCIVLVTPAGTRHTVTNVDELVARLHNAQACQRLNDEAGSVTFGVDGVPW